jgi:D-aspartate ligase
MPVKTEMKSCSNILPSASCKLHCPGAVVMDADYRGLAVVRSLGRRGIPVCVLEPGDHRLAALSRYTCRTVGWSARHSEEEKLKFLIHLADDRGIRNWMLFPTGDEDAAFVSRHHQTLRQYFELTTAPWEVLQRAYNKKLAYQLADEVGVGRPWTIYPSNRAEVEACSCQFPVILKPAYNSGFNRFTASKAWRVDTREQLLARYDEAKTLVDSSNLMIQELIPGGGESQFSYTALTREGRPLASLTARRARQFPMDFGRASTFVETIEDSASAAAGIRLLGALKYTGIAEVEFKRDPRDGKLKLLDINPRVWGWHSLCGSAGVDYPYLLWLLTIGEPIPPTKARVGTRWVRMSTDLPTAIREVLAGRLPLRAYLRTLRAPLASAIYAADDPLPGILEIPLLVYLAGKRILGRFWDRLCEGGNFSWRVAQGHRIHSSTPVDVRERPKPDYGRNVKGDLC